MKKLYVLSMINVGLSLSASFVAVGTEIEEITSQQVVVSEEVKNLAPLGRLSVGLFNDYTAYLDDYETKVEQYFTPIVAAIQRDDFRWERFSTKAGFYASKRRATEQYLFEDRFGYYYEYVQGFLKAFCHDGSYV